MPFGDGSFPAFVAERRQENTATGRSRPILRGTWFFQVWAILLLCQGAMLPRLNQICAAKQWRTGALRGGRRRYLFILILQPGSASGSTHNILFIPAPSINRFNYNPACVRTRAHACTQSGWKWRFRRTGPCRRRRRRLWGKGASCARCLPVTCRAARRTPARPKPLLPDPPSTRPLPRHTHSCRHLP